MDDNYRDIGVFVESHSTIFTRASTTANMSATQNPLISNPGTSLATKSTIRTLMMREASPSVTILSGRVRTWSTGTIVVLTIASTTATMKAVRYVSTVAPGMRYEAIATAIAERRRFTRRVIWRRVK